MRGGTTAAHMEQVWRSGEFFGEQRPTARATIRKGNVRVGPMGVLGQFASIIFSFHRGNTGNDPLFTPRELPSLKSVEWSRDVDNDVAQATITLYNTWDDPATGEITRGYLTWNRGDTPYDGGAIGTETTTPLVCAVHGMTSGAIYARPVVGGTAIQPFAPTGADSKVVSQIVVTLPAGAAGRYDVGIQDAGKGVVAINNSAKRWLGNTTNVQLNAGANTITLPKPVTLAGADSLNPHTYHLLLRRRDGARFNVYVVDGNGLSVACNTGTPGLSSRRGVYGVDPKISPVLFEMLGPTVTRKIGRRNDWFGMLVPDNFIQVFEGYGADYSVCPERDPNLMLTGTWMIDEVDMSGGLITLTCRDFGRILLEQILFPPITPRSSPIEGIAYPVSFEHRHNVDDPPIIGLNPVTTRYRDSSNTVWVGNSPVRGHYPAQGRDGNNGTYWLSVGNQNNNDGYSYEWFEVSVPNTSVSEARVYTKGGPYRCFVSVYANGQWVNLKGVIPYDPHNPVSAPNGSDKPYVTGGTAGADTVTRFPFGKKIDKVTRIRFTFTNLWNSGLGPWVYRAAVREVSAYVGTTTAVGHQVGNYDDYTDVIKLLLAWAGFHWPAQMPYLATSDGAYHELKANPRDDPYLRDGRIWGDLEKTGGFGPAKIEIPALDKKSIMDGITYIRDIVGFIFYIDHAGAVVWRAPNYHDRGNRVEGVPGRTQRFIRILDTETLQDISVKLNGRDVRERFYVATPNGKVAAGARGWNLNPIGLRRVAGWTDQYFDDDDQNKAQRQAQTMAQLLAMHTMMKYRTTTVTIAGLPVIEPDDQVELVDAVTGEGYLHWVRGVHSKLDHETGEYTFQLDTNWLGTRPGEDWFIDKYGKLNDNLQSLIDFTDRGRSDGAYDKFGRITL